MSVNIKQLKIEIQMLKDELKSKELLLKDLESVESKTLKNAYYNDVFSPEEIIRYSRQMLVPSISVNGQILLKNSKVLVVGVGGLGCPAILYMATAGVGEIVIIDYDEVELSNLHRQILHTRSYIGKPKVDSASHAVYKINQNVKIIPMKIQINSKNIEEIINNNSFNVVIDGSDNVPTRYLLNDVCVLHNIPLVSGSALQLDGQLTVYHYKEGPCYRCLFPQPPPVQTVMSCGDAGVLGAVPGVIGVLQALEAIKIIVGLPDILSGRFLIFDGYSTSFREMKLRSKNPSCQICGNNSTITSLIDYEQFCGSKAHDKVENIDILDNNLQVDVTDINQLKKEGIIIDVRPEIEFKMCKLPSTINFPYSQIEKRDNIDKLKKMLEEKLLEGSQNVYVLCRRGNDSQRAVTQLKNDLKDLHMNFYNIKGGLDAYSKYIDPNFPVY